MHDQRGIRDHGPDYADSYCPDSGRARNDDAAFDRLLIESIDRTAKKVTMGFGFGHEAQQLTAAERGDVIAYVRALAGSRKR